MDPISNEKMFGFLKTAMDASSLQHQLLAGNLANVDTPGYKGKSMDFFGVMREYVDQEAMQPPMLRDQRGALPPAQPLNFKNYIIEEEGALTERFDGNNVDLDKTMADLSASRGRYQLATQFMTRKVRLINDVIAQSR